MAPIIAGGREVGPALGQAAEGFQPGGIAIADTLAGQGLTMSGKVLNIALALQAG